MSHVLIGRFQSAFRLRQNPPDHARAVLAQLVDDLQVIAGYRPLALTAIAMLAQRLATPIRRRLASQIQTDTADQKSSE